MGTYRHPVAAPTRLATSLFQAGPVHFPKFHSPFARGAGKELWTGVPPPGDGRELLSGDTACQDFAVPGFACTQLLAGPLGPLESAESPSKDLSVASSICPSPPRALSPWVSWAAGLFGRLHALLSSGLGLKSAQCRRAGHDRHLPWPRARLRAFSPEPPGVGVSARAGERVE